MQIILGTMTFGEQLFKNDVITIIDEFVSNGYNRLDTAYVYNEGKSEELIGFALENLPRDRIVIDTKVNPRITGHLNAEAVTLQLEESLRRLNTDYIDTYYFHFPVRNEPFEDAISKIDKYVKRGMIKHFGLSNFPEDLVIRIYQICRENGWILPTVYEGLYNPLSRKAESLDDTLNKLNISFHCYNPLAGGLLTGRYRNYEEKPETGRFVNRPNYQSRYWNKSFFDAVNLIISRCSDYDIEITDAVFRWLAHSSMLKEKRNDAIIIGVSKISHLKNNIENINGEQLPDDLVSIFDEAWNVCKSEAPQYYRFYGEKE